MLWLTWQMWILLALALLIGAIVGWMARSRSDEAEKTESTADTPARRTEKTHGKPVGETPKAAAGSTPKPAEAAGGTRTQSTRPASRPASAKTAEEGAKARPADVPRHARGEATHASQAGPDPVGVGAIAPATPAPQDGGLRRETRDTQSAGAAEDLTRIRGLGPKAAEKLREAGVTTIAEISRWEREDVDRYDKLISGRGRITRDNWVGQARDIVNATG